MEFTKEEMLFTCNEMINHAIADIQEFDETEFAVDILIDLKEVIRGNQDIAKKYWINQSEPFGKDLEETLYYLCSNVHDPTHYLRTSIYTKVLE